MMSMPSDTNQILSDFIRSYQMLSLTIHICYIRKTCIPRLPRLPSDRFFFQGTMMFTHRNPEALGGGEFFGRVAFRIIHKGQTPRQERQFSRRRHARYP